MTDTRCWEIDRLAAKRLLSRLGMEATPATVEKVASEFAEHRMDVQQWAATRVQTSIIEAFEQRSIEDFAQMDAQWADGFMAAEQLVARLSTNELLDQPCGTAQSKGQVLRSMVRGARNSSAGVERRSD